MTASLGTVSRSTARLSFRATHGEAPRSAALRIKARGAWRTWGWSEVAHLTTALARTRDAGENEETPSTPSSPTIVAGRGDEVLVLGSAPVPGVWAEAWRATRFVLNLGEDDGDEVVDVRELAPHVVLASAALFERWAQDLVFAAGRVGARRVLADLWRADSRARGVGHPAPGLWERLAWRRWRASAGLRRARALVVTEGVLAPRTIRLFERAGLTILATEVTGTLGIPTSAPDTRADSAAVTA